MADSIKNATDSRSCSSEVGVEKYTSINSVGVDESTKDANSQSQRYEKDSIITRISDNLSHSGSKESSSVKSLPYDIFTRRKKWLAERIELLCDAKDTSTDLAVMGIYAAVSGAVGNRIHLQETVYRNSAMLWIIPVMRSSGGKSSIMKPSVLPLLTKNSELFDSYLKMKEDGAKAIRHKVVLTNTSNEMINVFVYENPTGGMLYHEEIMGLFSGFLQYSNSNQTAISDLEYIYDELTYPVDRIGRDSFVVKTPYLSIFGGIQPSLIPNVIGDIKLWHQGFYPRFLFGWVEHLNRIKRHVKKLPPNFNEVWNEFIMGLYNREWPGQEMELTPGAQAMYDEYYEYINSKYNDTESPEDTIGGKLKRHILVWSLVTAVIIGADTVDEEIMDYSRRCMDYFEWSILKVMDCAIGHKIKDLKLDDVVQFIHRINHKASQQEIGAILGCSQQNISKILKKSKK